MFSEQLDRSVLDELRNVLRRDRFRRFLSLTEVDEPVEELGRLFRIEQDPERGVPELRDPKDDYALFLARAVGADYIVSGDADVTDATLEPPAITKHPAGQSEAARCRHQQPLGGRCTYFT